MQLDYYSYVHVHVHSLDFVSLQFTSLHFIPTPMAFAAYSIASSLIGLEGDCFSIRGI